MPRLYRTFTVQALSGELSSCSSPPYLQVPCDPGVCSFTQASGLIGQLHAGSTGGAPQVLGPSRHKRVRSHSMSTVPAHLRRHLFCSAVYSAAHYTVGVSCLLSLQMVWKGEALEGHHCTPPPSQGSFLFPEPVMQV